MESAFCAKEAQVPQAVLQLASTGTGKSICCSVILAFRSFVNDSAVYDNVIVPQFEKNINISL